MSERDVMTDYRRRYAEETNVTFPGESAEYRVARDRLFEREAQLRQAMEAVAATRRELPPGGPVPEDHLFEGLGPSGSPTPVRLSELFDPGRDTLLIYSSVFGPDREEACPMCTAFLSLLDAAARQIADGLDPEVLERAGYPETPPRPSTSW
jgi:predicted dithiol-disulfide oxidoreductase (DUF899 family)